jgi:hypothetical protein
MYIVTAFVQYFFSVTSWIFILYVDICSIVA